MEKSARSSNLRLWSSCRCGFEFFRKRRPQFNRERTAFGLIRTAEFCITNDFKSVDNIPGVFHGVDCEGTNIAPFAKLAPRPTSSLASTNTTEQPRLANRWAVVMPLRPPPIIRASDFTDYPQYERRLRFQLWLLEPELLRLRPSLYLAEPPQNTQRRLSSFQAHPPHQPDRLDIE